MKKDFGKFIPNFNYTYGNSTRQFEDINNGNVFPFRYDRRHNINLSSIIKFSETGELILNWTYGSGVPYTEPTVIGTDIVNNIPVVVPIYTSRNNARFKANHRLDFTFNFYNRLKNGGLRWSFGLHNVYNQHNPIFRNVVRSENDPEQLFYENWGFFFPIPFLSIEFSF